MARHLFPGDVMWTSPALPTLQLAPLADFTMWTDRTGGTNVTADLKTPDGITALDPRADTQGLRPWLRGPDTTGGVEVKVLYFDAGVGARFPVYATDSLELVLAFAALVNAPNTWTEVQTFEDAPVVPDGSFTTAKITGFAAAVNAALADASVSNAKIVDGAINNAKVSTTAAIAASKLGTGTPAAGKYLDGAGAWTTLPSGGGTGIPNDGSVTDAKVAAAAAIAVSKLGSGTPASGKYLDGAGTWTTLPAGGGTPSDGTVTDAKIATAAAIATSKLGTGTPAAGKYLDGAGAWTTLPAAVLSALYDANTILAATADNTPAALTVGASTLVGRAASGGIAALTPAQVQTLLVATNEFAAAVYDQLLIVPDGTFQPSAIAGLDSYIADQAGGGTGGTATEIYGGDETDLKVS